ncbi:hypothetical protein [Fervidobacterium thailandense]|uniref:Uncharacterized protein n=1 Tax=Fervidobacterium thailandense TaxID=1008305 RepID=A0A1E3G353_9BACT|nr:hypothetical protein [Fervidobacterium thailandense]ODN30590.1 hypothetical protein A4H02_04965 [Fervidobacterium thailandense]
MTVYRYPLTFTIYMGKSQTALSPIGSFSARDESSRSTEWYYDLKEKGKRLEPNTTYYWQVEVKVSHGTDEKPLETTVKSPIWSFKTGYDVRP